MKSILGKLRHSRYFKALALLASGSLLGTLFTAVYQVVQTWIYTPDTIGVYNFLTAIPLMFVAVPALRYDIAVVVEKDERKALALVKLSWYLTIFTSLLITLVYGVYLWYFAPEYRQYLYVLPFAFLIVFGYGVNNLLNAYSNRCADYKTISRKFVVRSMAQRLGMALSGAVLISLCKLHWLSVLAMIVPYSLGQFAGIRSQAKPLLVHRQTLASITREELWKAAKLHKKQPLFSAPALFVNSFSYTSITLIMEKLFTTATIAYYSVSSRVLAMPISLVSGNVAKVFIEESSKEYAKEGRYWKSFKKTFLFLMALAVPMFLCMYFLAPPVCGWLLGDGWETAGQYIQVMALMFSFRLVGTSLSQVLVVCKKQWIELFINVGLVCASLLSGFLTWYRQKDVLFFLQSLNLLRSVCYFLLILMVFLYSRKRSTPEISQ